MKILVVSALVALALALLICLLFVLPGLEKPGSWLALRWWHWRERRRRGRARKRQSFPSPFSTRHNTGRPARWLFVETFFH